MSKSIISTSTIDPVLNQILTKELEALRVKERPGLHYDGPQWAYWAMHDNHVKQFDKLIHVLKQLKVGEWDKRNFSLLLDSLAMGPANVTPFAIEWSFKYAPKARREAAAKIASADYSSTGLTKAVLVTHPFPPSTCYDEMWRGFRGSKLKEAGAYQWLT